MAVGVSSTKTIASPAFLEEDKWKRHLRTDCANGIDGRYSHGNELFCFNSRLRGTPVPSSCNTIAEEQ
jgi:hypothetical protein